MKRIALGLALLAAPALGQAQLPIQPAASALFNGGAIANPLIAPVGSSTVTAIQNPANPATGIWFPVANQISICGNSGCVVINGAGQLTAQVGAITALGAFAASASGGTMGGSATLGGVFGGSGTVSDFTGVNKSGATVFQVPTGTTTFQLNATSYANCTGVTTNSSGVIACTASDRRLKVDDGVISPSEGLAHILSYPDAHAFHFKSGYGPSGQMQGFFAQDIAKVRPDLVVVGPKTPLTPDGIWQFDQTKLVADLVQAVKAQQAEIEELRKAISRRGTR